jgi:predicted O-methyltransferase YrrM
MNLLEGMTFCGEGNISWFPERMHLLFNLIYENTPNVILETGFNMGHSSILICEAVKSAKLIDPNYMSKDVNFYIFDICEHHCAKSNFEVVKNTYQDFLNLHFIEGSTFDTLKNYVDVNNLQIDFAEIDGDHSYEGVKHDITCVWDRINTNGIIYVDDYGTGHRDGELDRGVHDFDWSDFHTNSIEGVHWGKKK